MNRSPVQVPGGERYRTSRFACRRQLLKTKIVGVHGGDEDDEEREEPCSNAHALSDTERELPVPGSFG